MDTETPVTEGEWRPLNAMATKKSISDQAGESYGTAERLTIHQWLWELAGLTGQLPPRSQSLFHHFRNILQASGFGETLLGSPL